MFFELLVKKTTEGKKMSDSFTVDAIANSISELIYNSEVGITFQLYYIRYKGIFKKRIVHIGMMKRKSDYYEGNYPQPNMKNM